MKYLLTALFLTFASLAYSQVSVPDITGIYKSGKRCAYETRFGIGHPYKNVKIDCESYKVKIHESIGFMTITYFDKDDKKIGWFNFNQDDFYLDGNTYNVEGTGIYNNIKNSDLSKSILMMNLEWTNGIIATFRHDESLEFMTVFTSI